MPRRERSPDTSTKNEVDATCAAHGPFVNSAYAYLRVNGVETENDVDATCHLAVLGDFGNPKNVKYYPGKVLKLYRKSGREMHDTGHLSAKQTPICK